jgi:hypothetical protein
MEEKRSLVAKSAKWGSIKNVGSKIRRGKVVLDFIIERQTVEFSSVVKGLPS